jgi:ankyrin repeat protein
MNATRFFHHGVLCICLAALATPTLARKSIYSPVPARGKLGQDLFLAITERDLVGVQTLLKRGADPNSRNALEVTPLFVAAALGQTQVIEALLQAGAKLDAPSPGGTALTFAAMTGSVPALKLLLAHGANINPSRPDGITVLMMVSRTGSAEIISELLRRKADVNAKDKDGATALIFAARDGQEEAGRVLLSGAATVDAADSHGWTPLMYAAVNGHAGFVRLLLEKGANANTRDKKGRTPLLLAAAYGDHPEALRALLEAGADPRATDSGNHTALALATTRGHTQCAALLREQTGTADLASVGQSQRSPRQAVQVSLKALQRSMAEFTRRTGCVSCHQDGLGRVTTGTARQHGFAIDPAVNRAQAERINGMVNGARPLHLKALQDPHVMKQVPVIEIKEVASFYTAILSAMAAHQQPANEGTAAMTMVMARQQSPNGSWEFTFKRVPMQSSFFSTTALAVQALRTYGPRAHAAEVADRIRRAKAWLLTAPTEISEDRSFRLLGLKWVGASREEKQKAIDELRAEQRPDGGWPQTPALQSDAYATGQALYALHVAGGVPITDPLYQRGIQFLLRTQDEDGSWFVNKRAMPANIYFDAAFPHGQSQYASFNGTCWATLALLQTIDNAQPGPRRAVR